MKKKTNPLILGVGALAILCAVYAGVMAYGVHAKQMKAEQEEAEKTYLTNFTEVTEISYTGSQNRDDSSQMSESGRDSAVLTFIKDGNRWYYKEDREFPLLQYHLTSMAEEMGTVEAVRTLEDGEDLEQYGLVKPNQSFTVTDAEGNSATILIGNPVSQESGSDYYSMKEGDSYACTISAAVVDDIGKGLYDLIELEEFPQIAGENVQKITLTKNGVDKTYVKESADDQDNIAWYHDATSSEANKMDDNSIPNALADSVSQLIVEQCADYKADEEALKNFGLDQPQAVIRYSYDKNGEQGEVKLEIGNLDESGENYYTRKDESAAVNLISKELVDKCLNDGN